MRALKNAASENASHLNLCPTESGGTPPVEEEVEAVYGMTGRQIVAAKHGSLAFEEYASQPRF